MAKKTVEPEFEPIRVVPAAAKPIDIPDSVREEWKKAVALFKRDPAAKTAFAVDLTNLAMVRLKHVMENATSPSVILQVAKVLQGYVEFAFRETK